MPSVSTVDEHDNVTQACRIECEVPDILDRVPEVRVSMQLRGAGMKLSVSGREMRSRWWQTDHLSTE